MRDVNSKMIKTSKTLSLFSAIPVVGVVLNVTSKSIALARTPVAKSVTYFNSIEKPVITPSKDATEKVKGYVDYIKGKMVTTGLVLNCTKKTTDVLANCIKNVGDKQGLDECKIAVKEINKNLLKTNKEVIKLNKSLTNIENTAKEIAGVTNFTKPVVDGFKNIKPVLSKVSKATDELDRVLSKKIIKHSIKDILKSTSYVVKKLTDKAMKFLDPVLNKFKNQIPQIPGTEALTAEIDKVKDKYKNFEEESKKLKESYEKYSDYEGLIKDNVNKLVEKTGCGSGIEKTQHSGS